MEARQPRGLLRVVTKSYSTRGFVMRLWTIALMAAASLAFTRQAGARADRISPNRYHVELTVDSRGLTRSNSPASVDLDFAKALENQGGSGRFDQHTIEVFAYDSSGKPVVFDAARRGYERYLLPWRIRKYYGTDRVTLTFVMPDHTRTRYAVYFDTVESGRGRPDRYPGLVGDGDLFQQGYGRRELGPSKFGDMCDFDGDGDLDLFEGGIEPFVYCYENLHDQLGENKLVERGRLTSNGALFIPSANPSSNRAWMTVTFYDWDGDGDQDFFPSVMDGPDYNHLLFFRNTTAAGSRLTFSKVGQMHTVGGQPLGRGDIAGWFPTPTFVEDWGGDGDGLVDIIMAKGGFLYLHRNLGPGGAHDYRLDDGVKLQAGGVDIEFKTPRVECVDIDGDGDLDLFASAHAEVYWYKNVGTRRKPRFAAPVLLASMRHHYGGLKVADFHGNDGLLDIAVGTFWHGNADGDQPKSYGGLLKNLGPLDNPTFKLVLADAGAPYTEQFQICDAGQQNGVRTLDWDGDGDNDLVVSSIDGFSLFYRNLTDNTWPVFAPVEKLSVGGPGGGPLRITGPEGGYGRLDVADWNNDGEQDLIVADEEARVTVFLNDGSGADPPTFRPGMALHANGKPIDGLGRGSVLVCDWNNDGKKDLIMGMAPKGNVSSPYHDWPYQDKDTDKKDDEGFLYYENVGSDAEPVLAYPSWIRAGGQIITYTRPNLGSSEDWDGDGVKDFIGCNFEDSIRFYRNVGSGRPNTEPLLAPAAGTILVQPFCKTQMISGADVVDWRGDGDFDILTGLGHGGSGLRFYERDYINDFVNDTRPTVTVTTPDTRPAGRADAPNENTDAGPFAGVSRRQ